MSDLVQNVRRGRLRLLGETRRLKEYEDDYRALRAQREKDTPAGETEAATATSDGGANIPEHETTQTETTADSMSWVLSNLARGHHVHVVHQTYASGDDEMRTRVMELLRDRHDQPGTPHLTTVDVAEIWSAPATDSTR